MFKPRWKKEALLLLKGAKKFLHYKRDLLAPDRIDEIESRRRDLQKAVKEKNLDDVKEASKQLRNTCDKSLAHYRPPGWLEENVEVFWVAIVVALGIRAYFLQPFRIPTGSMQPSLNGIIAESHHEDDGWEKPWFGKQALDFLVAGKTYSKIIAKDDLRIVGIKDTSFLLFSKTTITFDNGSKISIGCPENEAQSIPTIRDKFEQVGNKMALKKGTHFKKGDVIFQGSLTSGDLVLVDKVSYHFRQPERGEAFVFDTRDINTDNKSSDEMSSQQGGQHYIKRLAGVPGDKLRIENPELYVNEGLAKEPGLVRVMDKGEDKKGNKYTGYTNPRGSGRKTGFSSPKYVHELEDPDDRNYREFFALGDNSPDSLDSRFWGSVKQYNLVGPAFISLWPFTSGHWGLID